VQSHSLRSNDRDLDYFNNENENDCYILLRESLLVMKVIISRSGYDSDENDHVKMWPYTYIVYLNI